MKKRLSIILASSVPVAVAAGVAIASPAHVRALDRETRNPPYQGRPRVLNLLAATAVWTMFFCHAAGFLAWSSDMRYRRGADVC